MKCNLQDSPFRPQKQTHTKIFQKMQEHKGTDNLPSPKWQNLSGYKSTQWYRHCFLNCWMFHTSKQAFRHCFIPVPQTLKSQNISPEPLCKPLLVNKKWAEKERMDWGMIFCRSDKLMQSRGRRDWLSFLARVLSCIQPFSWKMGATQQLENWNGVSPEEHKV